MARRDIIVIGGSAGGVEAVRKLVGALPASLSASLFVVLHIPPHERSYMQSILARVSALPVHTAEDGMPIRRGQIYVAVPNHHLVLDHDQVRVTRAPRENRARPAIDVLFRSAAYYFRERVIGVLLSGNLDDGTAGLWAIKDHGGLAIVQSPEEALFPSMPRNAIEQVNVNHVLPLADIPDALESACSEEIAVGHHAYETDSAKTEINVALGARGLREGVMDLGPVTSSTCPDCHGVLVEIREGQILRYRCHVGHAYSVQSLLSLLDEEVEDKLSNALRALDERVLLLQRLADQAKRQEEHALADKYVEQIAVADRSGEHLQQLLLNGRLE